MAKKEIKKNLVFKNKKAFHDFTILDTYEAGIVLEGSEVKAIREGRVNLKDSFVRIIKNELFLLNTHISHLSTAHTTYRPDERRDRKLLFHRKDISNNLQKKQQPMPSTKVGLENIKSRYAFFSDEKVSVEADGNYYTVRLPLIQMKDDLFDQLNLN